MIQEKPATVENAEAKPDSPAKTPRTRQQRQPALPSVNGSALVGLYECPLHRKTPFGICNVRMTQFSIARFYGGIKYNGESFTYLPHRRTHP